MAATARSVVGAAEIVVVALEELFPGTESFAELTFAVFVMLPLAETTTLALMVIVTLLPKAMVPRLQSTNVPCEQLPCVVDATGLRSAAGN